MMIIMTPIKTMTKSEVDEAHHTIAFMRMTVMVIMNTVMATVTWIVCHLYLGAGEAQVAELSRCSCSTDCNRQNEHLCGESFLPLKNYML